MYECKLSNAFFLHYNIFNLLACILQVNNYNQNFKVLSSLDVETRFSRDEEPPLTCI